MPHGRQGHADGKHMRNHVKEGREVAFFLAAASKHAERFSPAGSAPTVFDFQ